MIQILKFNTPTKKEVWQQLEALSSLKWKTMKINSLSDFRAEMGV